MFRQPEIRATTRRVRDEAGLLHEQGRHAGADVHPTQGAEAGRQQPDLLYGYGGFNISLTPAFIGARLALLERAASTRGEPARRRRVRRDVAPAGTKLRKQNVFDDFIAAAEWLIANKYTSPARLAIQGGSNGGLLVGAVMNQRPDLFRVALPAVGVMDMLRFHKFTIGWTWVADYGSSDDPDEFKALFAYSPLHNIKAGREISRDAGHDRRPRRPRRAGPLVQVRRDAAGAGEPRQPGADPHRDASRATAASNLTKQLETIADVYAFMLYNLGVA